ncbi:hypothetical protein Tco_0241801 [Tanacetum coccineum]
METRPEQNRETTPPLRMRSPRVHRQRERVVGFEEAPNREGGRIERNVKGGGLLELGAKENGSRGMNLPPLLVAHLGRSENDQALQSSLTSVYGGHQPSTNIGGNLPPNGMHLSHHAQPFIPSSLHPSNGFIPGYVNSYPQPFTGTVNGKAPSYPPQAQNGNPSFGGTYAHHPKGGYVPQTFTNSNMPPNNSQQNKFIKTHLAVHNIKKREGESIRAFATRYTDDTLQILRLHEDQRISIFVHGLRTRYLLEFLSTDLPSTYKGLMEKTYAWIEARDVATNETPNNQREHFERSKKTTWDNSKGQRNRDSLKKRPVEEDHSNVGEITFPPLLKTSSADPVIIKAYISGRQVNWIPLSRFEDSPHRFLEGALLAFRRSASGNYNWGRTVMQQMGIIVSTIHGAIKFHTPKGIGTILLEYKPHRIDEGQEETNKTSKEDMKDILRVPKTIMVGGEPFNPEHRMNKFKQIEPVKQNKRSLEPEKNEAIRVQVEELTKANILREVVGN